ncbi:MAG: transglutaminase domain-containing protein [Candidatus Woesearchaeota archaeon]|nr:transglutaminase domain-containing protein [Candidatus Woesearchaeota archaeon]
MLFIIPVVLAEQEYFLYKDIDLNFQLSSELDLKYTVASPKINYVKSSIALFPREDYRQTILDFKTNSDPDATITKDGNLVYEWVEPSEKILKFSLNSRVKSYNDFKKIGDKVDFPVFDDEYSEYTKETKYIDINQDIIDKANELVKGENDEFKATFKLAEWVRGDVKYDLNTLTAEAVQKSSWVMKNRKGVCDEITNLFISMCRSVNIPARFVSGVVYSNIDNSFGNHGWAEVYFPNYGWVPFDVTFGQYGWLDATHIKLKDSKDSGEPSAEYSWRSNGLQVDAKKLKISTSIITTGDNVEQLISLKVEPVEKEIGFGSYVPVRVTIENLKDYYVSSSIFLTKAPGLIGTNSKTVLLKPNEIKQVYWIISIPENLDKNYIYDAAIEVRSLYGDYSLSQIKYSSKYKKYSLEEAQDFVDIFSERDSKIIFTNLNLNCSSDKKIYYVNETAYINCVIKNEGNIEQDKINICLDYNCEKIDLGISQQKNVNFNYTIIKNNPIKISAENSKMIKDYNLNVKIIKIPEVYISNITPKAVNYKDNVDLYIILNSDDYVSDIKLNSKLGNMDIDYLEGSQEIHFNVKGKELINGVTFDIIYKDEAGKEYTKKQKIDIQVLSLPWYKKLLSLI